VCRAEPVPMSSSCMAAVMPTPRGKGTIRALSGTIPSVVRDRATCCPALWQYTRRALGRSTFPAPLLEKRSLRPVAADESLCWLIKMQTFGMRHKVSYQRQTAGQHQRSSFRKPCATYPMLTLGISNPKCSERIQFMLPHTTQLRPSAPCLRYP